MVDAFKILYISRIFHSLNYRTIKIKLLYRLSLDNVLLIKQNQGVSQKIRIKYSLQYY